MRMVRALVLVAVAAGFASADEKMAGDWKVTEGTKAGEKADTSKYKTPAVFTKDTITFKTEEATFEFKYTTDAKAKPTAIDMEIVKPEGFKGAKAKGIIKMDGDTVTLCYNPDGEGKRPEKFESTKDNGCFLWVLKKAAK